MTMDEANRPVVLLVAHQYWPTPGSATQVMSALVRELRQRRFPVEVATTGDPVDGRRILEGPYGERVHLVTGAESSGASLKRLADLAAFAWGAWRLGRRVRPGVVVSDPPPTAAWAASRVARGRRVPFIFYFSDSWAQVTEDSDSVFARAFNGLASALEASVLRSSDAAIAVTAELGDVASRIGAANVLTVPNGVDTDVFTDEGPSWYPTAERRPFLLYAGKAGLIHGGEVFALGAETLWREGADFDCVYMGYGAASGPVEEVAGRWPDRLHLVPNQPASTVAAAYRSSIGALSSLLPLPNYTHARLMKALSGMACGSPAVYAGAGDLAEVIAANDLGFVNPWSAEGAAASMRAALDAAGKPESATRRAAIRRFAREHFDERQGAARVVDAIESALASKGQ